MIKKCFTFLLFFISFIVFNLNVSAANVIGYKEYYNDNHKNGDIGSCGNNSAYCWPAPYVQAVRITIYDKNGKKISNTVDFVNSTNTHDILLDITATYYTGNKNRVDYIKSGAGNLTTGNVITTYLEFDNFICDDSFSSCVADDEGVFRDALNRLFENKNSNKILSDVLSFCNGEYSGACNGLDTDDIYAVLEPATVIVENTTKKNYYGTYYELLQMLDATRLTNSSLYKGRRYHGVDCFLPANMALSQYVTSDSDFNSFFSKIGLNPVMEGTSKFNSLYSKVSESCTFSDVNWHNDYISASNGYGIAVMKVVPQTQDIPSDELESCETNIENVPCEGKIVYEANGCLFDAGSHVTMGETGDRICQIQCDEKYHMATWTLNHSFKSITSETLLAGAYFPINGPVVYHKKTCQYVEDMGPLDSYINNMLNSFEPGCLREEYHSNCTVVSDSEICNPYTTTYIDSSCQASLEALRDSYEEQCIILEESLPTSSEMVANNDYLGETKLHIFSDYVMSPSRTDQILNVDGYQYGYKNTFVYGLINVNRFIGMNTIYNQLSDIGKVDNYDQTQPMATTPISLKNGTYYYDADFRNIRISEYYKSLFDGKYGANAINNTLKWSCPYEIKERNIKTTCDPNSQTCNFDNPDQNFDVPSIRMVFRSIDLSTPFPGKYFSGVQRKPGPNWIADDIKTYITDTADTVYSGDPMYVIELDAQDINAIREYNDTHDYDDFALECTEGKGTECLSTFLRDNDLITDGTCNTEDRSQFYSCAGKAG